MPQRALRPCSKCGTLTLTTPCGGCAKRRDQRRGSARQRGYGAVWEHRRKQQLAREPYCRACLAEAGRGPLLWPTPRQSVEAELLGAERATDVDHIVPKEPGAIAGHERDDELQSLCGRHHKAKTMRELREALA